MPNTQLSDLTGEIARLIDLQGVRTFDGHIVVDEVNYTKGTIAASVRHAHDQAEVLKFTLALAL